MQTVGTLCPAVYCFILDSNLQVHKEKGGLIMSVFEGAGVALVTPMKDNGDVELREA